MTQVGASSSTKVNGECQLDVSLPIGTASVTVTAVSEISGVTCSGSATIHDLKVGRVYPLDPMVISPTDLERQSEDEWVPTLGTLPESLSSSIIAAEVLDDGSGPSIYVAGAFSSSCGTTLNGVAKWDGNSWSPLGVGVGGVLVWDFVVYDDGGGPALHAGLHQSS